MEKITLSPQGPHISPLVAGVMLWGVWGKNYHHQTMHTLIKHGIDLGITTFDHADIYGDYTTEAQFGKALSIEPGLRPKIQLISKCGIKMLTANRPAHRIKSYDTSRQHIISSVEQSLQNLHTDYLDLLLIHRPDPLLDPTEVAEAVSQLKGAGKIRAFGVSNFTPTQVEVLRQATPIATNQVEISVLHRAPFTDGTLDQCMRYGMRPMAWSPLGGYFARNSGSDVKRLRQTVAALNEKYGLPGEDVILLAWLLRHPAGIVPVLGTGRTERLTAAAQALDIELNREDWFAILEAAAGQEVA